MEKEQVWQAFTSQFPELAMTIRTVRNKETGAVYFNYGDVVSALREMARGGLGSPPIVTAVKESDFVTFEVENWRGISEQAVFISEKFLWESVLDDFERLLPTNTNLF